VFLLALLAHGLVLLTDFLIWDGWWANADLGLPDAGILTRQLTEAGKPMEGWFLAPLRLLGSFESRVIAAKAAGVACWVGSFLAMHVCLRRLARLPLAVATAIACLAAVAPVYEVLGDVSLVMYPAGVLLFWIGWVLVADSLDRRGTAALFVRAAALALLFVSFNVNSLLVMHYAVAATFAILRLRDLRWPALRGRAAQAAMRAPDLLAVPIVFWLWKSVFTPTSGHYADYNRVAFELPKLALGCLGLVVDFLTPMMRDAIASGVWLLLAAVATAATWWLTTRRPETTAAAEPEPWLGERLVACGIALIVAAAFPYMVVGQAIMSYGWWSRSCLLFPLPIAMTIVGLLLSMNRRVLPGRPAAWLVGTVAIAVLFLGACWRDTLTMQAYGAKQAAIRRDLQELIRRDAPAAIQLRDYYPIRGTNDFYPIAIWTFLAAPADALPTTLVLETGGTVPGRVSVGDDVKQGADGKPMVVMGRLPLSSAELQRLIDTETGMPYAMTAIRRTGPHLLVAIHPAAPGSDDGPRIGIEYLRRRWLAPDTLNDYVTSLTRTLVEPLPPITN